MQTVIETNTFIRAAKHCGISDVGVRKIVNHLAKNPTAGSEIAGTGGMRKLRVTGRGKGKSGGYRVITFYSGETIPVFLITVYGKNEVAELTQSEKNAMKRISKELSDYANSRK